MGPIASLDAVEKSNISWPYRESNLKYSAVQPIIRRFIN
jgi:hypothetical protein